MDDKGKLDGDVSAKIDTSVAVVTFGQATLPARPPSTWTAALQVLAGHLMIFDTFGYIGSWGLFQSYYTATLGRSQSDISWVGSLQLFLVFCVGTFSGRSLDAGYLRTTLAAGCALQILGIFTTAEATQYWQLILSQGICVGLGNGLTFCPVIALISTYYGNNRRAFAVSLAAAGAATGGMVFPAATRQLLASVGAPWTIRALGTIFVVNTAITLAVARPKVGARKVGPLVEWAAFKELPYLLFAVGAFLALWGLYFAYYYVCALNMACPFASLTLLTRTDLRVCCECHPHACVTVVLPRHRDQWYRHSGSHYARVARVVYWKWIIRPCSLYIWCRVASVYVAFGDFAAGLVSMGSCVRFLRQRCSESLCRLRGCLDERQAKDGCSCGNDIYRGELCLPYWATNRWRID